MALTTKGNIKIGTVELSPASIKISYESIATNNSGRTADGVMHISYIKTNIPKLSIEMPPMTASDAYSVLNLVQGKVYQITFYDPSTNTERTIEAYTGTSNADCYSGVVLNGLYKGISFNAIGTGATI